MDSHHANKTLKATLLLLVVLFSIHVAFASSIPVTCGSYSKSSDKEFLVYSNCIGELQGDVYDADHSLFPNGQPPANRQLRYNYATAKKACEVLGYDTVESYGCTWPENNNRCTYHSERNYYTFGWDGTAFRANAPKTVYGGSPVDYMWLIDLTCSRDVPQKECADGIDNDNDGQIDAADAGCWDDPADPTTYNEDLDDEGKSDITCFTNTDCGDPLFLGNVCQGTNLFEKYTQNTCTAPGTGVSTCAATNVTNFLNACTFGCTSGACNPNPNSCTTNDDCSSQNYETNPYCGSNGNVYKDTHTFICAITNLCQDTTQTVLVETCSNGCFLGSCVVEPTEKQCADGIDNDNDQLTDSADPGCWDDTTDPTTYNPNLDDESRKNPECLIETDCGTDGYTAPFCGNGNVLKTYTDYTCNVDYTCSQTTTNELVQICSIGCADGTCTNGGDTQGPVITILAPQNGTTVSGTVQINYTVEDPSGVAKVELIINGVVEQTHYNVSTGIHTFTQTFPNENTEYTIILRAYDTLGNTADESVTFFYGSGNSCSVDSDCGSVTTNLICKHDDVYERTTAPVCSATNTCSADVTEDFVESCRYGCLNGRCKDNDDNDNDDDDENPIIIYANPIIKDTNKTVELDSVLFLAEPVVLNEPTTSFNWWAFFIWLLIIAIIVLIILIVFYIIL